MKCHVVMAFMPETPSEDYHFHPEKRKGGTLERADFIMQFVQLRSWETVRMGLSLPFTELSSFKEVLWAPTRPSCHKVFGPTLTEAKLTHL